MGRHNKAELEVLSCTLRSITFYYVLCFRCSTIFLGNVSTIETRESPLPSLVSFWTAGSAEFNTAAGLGGGAGSSFFKHLIPLGIPLGIPLLIRRIAFHAGAWPILRVEPLKVGPFSEQVWDVLGLSWQMGVALEELNTKSFPSSSVMICDSEAGCGAQRLASQT